MKKHNKISELNVGGFLLGRGRVFIIAEIGSNHGGNVDHAMELVRAAKENGADCVKFQSFLADEIVLPGSDSYPLLKRLELSRDDHLRISSYAAEIGIPFFSTCSNEISLEWLLEIGVPAIKIASTNLNCLSLVRKAALSGRPVLLSTGMSMEKEIEKAVEVIEAQSGNKILIMHCVSDYPAASEDANVAYIERLYEKFGYPTGYSDHTPDPFSSVLAVSKGAVALEKHFTLRRDECLPDSSFSLDPGRFRRFVSEIRKAEKVIGDGIKKMTAEELQSRHSFRRSIYARVDISNGHKITKSDIKLLRPCVGIDASEEDSVIGSVPRRDIRKDDPLKWEDLKR